MYASFICTWPSKNAPTRPLVVIEPPWLRKSHYTSLIVQTVVAAAFFWQDLLAVDMGQATQQVETNIT